MVEDMIGKGEPSLSSNQVVLSAGEDQYQTVTIVPNDSASGEVSYVLIVQQNEEKKDGGEEEDLEGVYDFEGGEDGEYDEDGLEGLHDDDVDEDEGHGGMPRRGGRQGSHGQDEEVGGQVHEGRHARARAPHVRQHVQVRQRHGQEPEEGPGIRVQEYHGDLHEDADVLADDGQRRLPQQLHLQARRR